MHTTPLPNENTLILISRLLSEGVASLLLENPGKPSTWPFAKIRYCWQLHLLNKKIFQLLYPLAQNKTEFISLVYNDKLCLFFWDTKKTNNHNYNIKVICFSFFELWGRDLCSHACKASILQICSIQVLPVFLMWSQTLAKCLALNLPSPCYGLLCPGFIDSQL